jgi:hypothetical protein
MQLTTARLKQIIKEELEAITNEMTETETETEVDEVDAEIASLEQQLAEAKKKAAAKSKTGGMKVMKGDANAHSSAKSGMKPMSGKRHDMKKGK